MGKLGRSITGKRQKYSLINLTPRGHEIVRRSVLGQSRADIAKELGVSPQTVTLTNQCATGIEKTKMLQEARDGHFLAVTERIREASVTAAKVLQEILTDPMAKHSDKITAARDLLDRAGHGAVAKSASFQQSLSLTPGDIYEMRKRVEESGLLAQEVEVTS